MRNTFISFLSLMLLVATCLTHAAGDDVVIADGDVSITRAEFEAALAAAPEMVKRLAASDLGDRFEMINALMTSRKLAASADSITADDPSYWQLQFQLVAAKEKFYFDRLMNEISIGNVEPLAREYYKTRKDEYALVPEKRSSSHILFASPPGRDRVPVRAKAREVLEQLRAGADFEAMVAEHSDDKRSAERGGAIERVATLGDPSLALPYTGALFDIENIGEYSEITDTQFGVHIVRLDGIVPSSYQTFDEVAGTILGDIVQEVRALSAKEVRSRYHLSEDAFIDGAAMEEAFAPYR